MTVIGLIGGMSWESSLIYYRLLNERTRARHGGQRSADILMRSVDFETIVALQKADRWDEAGAVLAQAAAGLEAGGADCVLICTNTMHLVAPAVSRALAVPLIDIIAATGVAVRTAGFKRPLLLSTRYTAEHGFYAERMQASAGIEVMTPASAEARGRVHDIIFSELCQGIVRPASREEMRRIVADGVAAGADCVILGCTELCLLVDDESLACPVFDSTAIHVDAALAFAEGEAAPSIASAA
ncbi:aspartate racemase [Kaistia soli DSM 19436]|uniref:Aspartate racemase n=1 Tax=Kaistia soli DSM 19436 TaxID=1122133 RepID=A0A1M4YPQ4_9HYPH|nr:aspartate/glutamate racemase family protein [Kaistia soli]SHF07658.1 aspartate racemase [Kaistia soli DSM 19436]